MKRKELAEFKNSLDDFIETLKLEREFELKETNGKLFVIKLLNKEQSILETNGISINFTEKDLFDFLQINNY